MTTLFNLFEGKSKEEAMALVGGYYEVEETVAEIDRLQQKLKNKIEILANNNSVPKSLIKEVLENKKLDLSNITYNDILVAPKETNIGNVVNSSQSANFVFEDTNQILAKKKELGISFWEDASPDFLHAALVPILDRMVNVTSTEFQKVRSAYKVEFNGLPHYSAITKVFGGWSNFVSYLNNDSDWNKNVSNAEPRRVKAKLRKGPFSKWTETSLAKLAEELKKEKRVLIADNNFSVPVSLYITEKEAKQLYKKVLNLASTKNSKYLKWRDALTPVQLLSLVTYFIDAKKSYRQADILNIKLNGMALPCQKFFFNTFGNWQETLNLMYFSVEVPQKKKSLSEKIKDLDKANKNVNTVTQSKKEESVNTVNTNTVNTKVNPNNLTGPAFLSYFENGLNLLTDLNDEDSYINNLMDSKLMETVSFPSLNVIESNYADFSDALNAYYLNKFKGFEFNSETGSQLVEEFIKLGKPQNKKEFNKAFFSNGNSKKFVPLNVILTSLSTYDFYFNYVTSCIAEW